MKTALVYDRVNKWGGAERVLLALHEIFPDAPLYTSVYDSKRASWAAVFPKVYSSFLQKIPFASTNHELLAPLMPIAFESFNLDEFDLVISVTSEAAKGIITKPCTKHICYCLTPTRYLWSHYETYFKGSTFKGVTWPVVDHLKRWDRIASQRPDVMIAISTEVQNRIKKYYDRDSEIIFPPVDTLDTTPLRSGVVNEENFFLVVSRLVPYKKVDLAIAAFNKMGVPLVIVGTGSEEGKLKRMAKENIKFVGQLTYGELAVYYKRCVALIMPQEEDFGIVAVEAQLAGTPVIAYKRGGVLDTVKDGVTGIFFPEPTVDSLVDAIKRFEKMKFKPEDCINQARKFSKERFQKEFGKLIENI